MTAVAGQGIYPVLIVILVHKQLSYIEFTTGVLPVQDISLGDIAYSTRTGWSSHTAVLRARPVEVMVDVDETHSVRKSSSGLRGDLEGNALDRVESLAGSSKAPASEVIYETDVTR